MTHQHPSPFPLFVPKIGVVIDERCICGQLRSEHQDTSYSYGHGAAPGCVQFTWIEFILSGGRQYDIQQEMRKLLNLISDHEDAIEHLRQQIYTLQHELDYLNHSHE